MNVCAIRCGLPYVSRQTAQTQSSIVLRTTAVACGTIAVLIGLLMIYGMIDMHQLGTTIGWTSVALGSVSIFIGLCIKCVPKSSWPEPMRHAIYRRGISAAAPITIESNTGVASNTRNALTALPTEVLYQILAPLELPDFFRLSRTSKEMYKRIDQYLLYRCPIKSTILADYSCPVTQMKDVEALGHTQLVFELCEKDSEYKPKKLTFERLREILQFLKENNLLFLLNAIPIPPRWSCELYDNSSLQYWASCGKIEYVALLVEHGAKDYFSNCAHRNRSALFRAAVCGEITVVNYLLENGAHAGIRFDHNFLRSFIPDFICHCPIGDPSRQIKCFKRILEYMIIYQPKEFRFQLRVPIYQGNIRNPVSRGFNAMRWTHYLSRLYEESIYEIVKMYGANEEDVLKVPENATCLITGPL